MNLTREQAVTEFRKMWKWIAEETFKQKRKVLKREYFEKHNLKRIRNDCYLCEYDSNQKLFWCKSCPIIKEKYTKSCCNGLYGKWEHAKDYKVCAELAKQISELPESEV